MTLSLTDRLLLAGLLPMQNEGSLSEVIATASLRRKIAVSQHVLNEINFRENPAGGFMWDRQVDPIEVELTDAELSVIALGMRLKDARGSKFPTTSAFLSLLDRLMAAGLDPTP